MGKYWIRNRGRTEGPFDEEKIQGLMRRGRFNRHYQVSEDKKSWYPASDFPELLSSPTGRGRGGDDDDDDGGARGGSIFENDYDEAPARSKSKSSRSAPAPAKKGQSPFSSPDSDDDDDDLDNDLNDDDDDDEDSDDESDDEGFVYRVAGWVESQWRGIVGVLALVLVALGWYVFGRENWTIDTSDMDTLIAVHSRVNSVWREGTSTNEWERLAEKTESELADMVARLNATASAKDHVKQELLFTARDDIPRMFKELPQGDNSASKRIEKRFNVINEMITGKTRQHQETIFVPPAPQPPPVEAAESLDPGATETPATIESNSAAAKPETGVPEKTPQNE